MEFGALKKNPIKLKIIGLKYASAAPNSTLQVINRSTSETLLV